MSFVRSGVNTVLRTRIYAVSFAVLTVLLCSCSKQEPSKSSGASAPVSDRQAIQDDLNEVVARWHDGDKAVLYDNEFPYVRDRFTFDDYLKFRELSMDADTVSAMNVQDVSFFGRDSARVQVEVVFTGPTGKVSKRIDHYLMYHSEGRWIRPTVGLPSLQAQWDSLRHAADSAAEAESKESDGK